MACAVERVSLYCGGEGAGPRPELRSDVSCQEESSRSSCSSSAGGGCGGTTTSSAITTTSTGTRNKRKAASPRRRQLAKRPRPEESPFRPWGGHQETDDHEETGRSPSGEERIPEVVQSPQPAGRPEDMASSSSQDSPPSTQPRPMDFPPPPPPPTSRCGSHHIRGQRNYKNMTRERRMEANARERSRVHTISAAFETLRKAVPAYSHNQKLSKLSVLRVAASYILTLSRVLGTDYSHDQSSPSVAECVDNVTATIQMEGKLRKKKDE